MKRISVGLALTATAFEGSAALAHAQTPHPQHPGGQRAPPPMTSPQSGMPVSGSMPGGMMEMSRPMMAGGRGMSMSAEQVEGRIAVLKAKLKITNVQDELRNSSADTMRTNGAAMKTMRDGMMTRGMPTTLPDRLAAQQKMIAARAAMLDGMETSTKPLYAALSTDQRKVIDQMTAGPMGMM